MRTRFKTRRAIQGTVKKHVSIFAFLFRCHRVLYIMVLKLFLFVLQKVKVSGEDNKQTCCLLPRRTLYSLLRNLWKSRKFTNMRLIYSEPIRNSFQIFNSRKVKKTFGTPSHFAKQWDCAVAQSHCFNHTTQVSRSTRFQRFIKFNRTVKK